jgi:hypothetical protein
MLCGISSIPAAITDEDNPNDSAKEKTSFVFIFITKVSNCLMMLSI